MSIAQLSLREIIASGGYIFTGPFGCHEDPDDHYNIIEKAGNNWVGSLLYPFNEHPDISGKISVFYKASIYEKDGSTSIEINHNQINAALNFRDFLKTNNITYEEFKEGAASLKKIASFLRKTNPFGLDQLANRIDE